MIGVDAYADRTSPIHRWDPRYKIVGLVAVAFAFAAVRELWLLPAMVAVTVALVVASRLPWAFVGSRLRYPGVVVLGLGLALPLLSGPTVLASLGPVALRLEGTLLFVLVAVRFACLLTLALVLFGTATVHTSIAAMRALGVPALMTDMALLAYRYVHELGRDLSTMQRAARLRGARVTVATSSSVVASLLVRSYERSERVHHAMVLRGYGTSTRVAHDFGSRPHDVVGLVAALLVATGLVVAGVVTP